MKTFLTLLFFSLLFASCHHNENEVLDVLEYNQNVQKQLNEILENKLTIDKLTTANNNIIIELSDNQVLKIQTYDLPMASIDITDRWDSYLFTFTDGIKISINKTVAARVVQNNSLPKSPEKLKILGIGNSFTEDATEYLPHMIKADGLKNITVARAFNGGMSLRDQWEKYLNKEPYYFYDKTDPQSCQWNFHKSQMTLAEIIGDEDWDIIVLQQISDDAGLAETFQPYLNNLIEIILEKCANKKVCIAWHMTWAYATNSPHPGYVKYDKKQMKMYRDITNATKQMEAFTGINIIIPSGTAIQNLRNTSLNNPPLDLTRDGYHSDYGAGRYVEACAWFQTLIAPCFNTTIIGNTYRANFGNVPVTDNNAGLIQKTALSAVDKKYEISALN